MDQHVHDKTGVAVSVALHTTPPICAYTVGFDDGVVAGRAEFVDSTQTPGDRIFFHTEVAEEFGGRGLAGILVRHALADCLSAGLTVVPVCPLFAAHLREHGAQYRADGGVFRRPTPADIALVTRATDRR
ncbi:GNAT family N-acetyltransferase [Gordonia iterans]